MQKVKNKILNESYLFFKTDVLAFFPSVFQVERKKSSKGTNRQ